MFDTRTLDRRFADANELAAELKKLLEQMQFNLNEPIVLRRNGGGPVFDVRHRDGHVVIEATDSEARRVRLGIGLGSHGIVASEIVPDTNFAIDPTLVNELFSTQGNVARDALNSGFDAKRSGSGRPHETSPFIPRAGWADMLTSVQKSGDIEHAPDSAVKMARDGQLYWWVTEPWKWQFVRCTVTAVNEDTLTCNVVANGKVVAEAITVAKPCNLQQTPFDGNTIDGVTYTYTTSQAREHDDGSTQTDQTVSPPYSAESSFVCPEIYAKWVGNQTDIAGVHWLDVNNDARRWVPEP